MTVVGSLDDEDVEGSIGSVMAGEIENDVNFRCAERGTGRVRDNEVRVADLRETNMNGSGGGKK